VRLNVLGSHRLQSVQRPQGSDDRRRPRNAKWKESGRKGAANNLLGLLVKDEKLKRAEAKDVRGSVHSAARFGRVSSLPCAEL